MPKQHIKICGLTSNEAVEACASTGCGLTGFIAHPPSPRHLSSNDMQACRRYVAPNARAVLVTVNATDAVLDEYIEAVNPDMLQLHGNESPERCTFLKRRYHLPIIKAFGVSSAQDLEDSKAYHQDVDMLLLDTKNQDGSSGGTGRTFDWSLLQHYAPPLPFFLSGGLGIENIQQAQALNITPYMDVSSALESSKGIKDPRKIIKFMEQINAIG